jgi:hypothetical protein
MLCIVYETAVFVGVGTMAIHLEARLKKAVE